VQMVVQGKVLEDGRGAGLEGYAHGHHGVGHHHGMLPNLVVVVTSASFAGC